VRGFEGFLHHFDGVIIAQDGFSYRFNAAVRGAVLSDPLDSDVEIILSGFVLLYPTGSGAIINSSLTYKIFAANAY
jgi:hypothetical protein